LYGEKEVRYFVSATKNLKVHAIVESAEKVGKEAAGNGSKLAELIGDIAIIAKRIVTEESTVVSIKLNKDAKIADLVNDVHAIINVYYTNETLDTTFTELANLYSADDATIGNIKNASLNIECEKVIKAVRAIGGTIGAVTKVTDRICKLAEVSLSGTIGSPNFDFNGLWNEANNTEKIIIVSVGAVAGTILYFAANDTLISIVDKALGENAKIGDLVKKYWDLGYTEKDGKYSYDGRVNGLVTEVFNTTVQAVLTRKDGKSFDFKAAYYDYLRIDDILLFAKAVTNKYKQIKVVNTAFDEVAGLYNAEDAMIYKVVTATKALKLYDIIDAAKVIGKSATNNQTTMATIDKSAGLVKLFITEDSIVSKAHINKKARIASVIEWTYLIVRDYFSYRVTNVAFEELIALYGADDATIDNIVGATKAIKIRTIIDSVTSVAKGATKDEQIKVRDTFDQACKIAKSLVTEDSTVAKVTFNGDAEIATIIDTLKSLVNVFKQNITINTFFDETAAIYRANDARIKNFVAKTKEIKIDDVITVLEKTVVTVNGIKGSKENVVKAVADALRTIFAGTIGKAGIQKNITVIQVAGNIESILKAFDAVTNNAMVVRIIESSVSQIASLYGAENNLAITGNNYDVRLKDIAKVTPEFSVDSVIIAGGEIAKSVYWKLEEPVNAIVDLLTTLFAGKLKKPGFERNANVGELLTEISVLTKGYGAPEIVNTAVKELAKIFDGVTLGKFVEGTKAILFKDILSGIKATLACINGLNDKLETVYKYVEILICGDESTIGSPKLNVSGLFTDSRLTKTEKIIIAGVIAGAGIALYNFANPVLVKLAKAMFSDATWGAKFAKTLGYSLDSESGNYLRNDGVYNKLADVILKEGIANSLDKSAYSLTENLFPYLTLGNVLTFNKSLQEKVEKPFKGETIVSDGNGGHTVSKTELSRVASVLLNLSVKEVLDNKSKLKDFALSKVDHLTMSDLGFGYLVSKLGKDKNLTKVGFNATATYDAVTEKWTYSGSFAKLFTTMFNYTVKTLRDAQSNGGLLNFVKEGSRQLTIGDIAGEAMLMVINKGVADGKKAGMTIEKDEASGKWTVSGKYASLFTNLFNINIRDFAGGLTSTKPTEYLARTDVLGSIYIGELLDGGYNRYNAVAKIWYTKGGAEKDFGEGFKGILLKRVYSIRLGEILTSGYDVNNVVDGVYLGDALGYDCENVGTVGHEHSAACTVWYKTATVYYNGELTEKLLEADAIYNKLCGIAMVDLMNGNLDIVAEIETLDLGELMGYMPVTENGVTEYYSYKKYESGTNSYYDVTVTTVGETEFAHKQKGEKVDELTAAIADVKVKDMLDGDGVNTMMNRIETLKIGSIMRYTLDESVTPAVWYNDTNGNGVRDDGESVEGVLAKLSAYTLSEVKNDFGNIIQEFTLEDVLGDSCNSNSVLRQLKSTTIGDLSTAVDGIYVGSVLGYVKSEGENAKWYRDENNNGLLDANETTEMTGVMTAVADFTIGEFDDVDFNERLVANINELKLSDVLGADAFANNKILDTIKDSKISELDERINSMYVGELLDYYRQEETTTDGYKLYQDYNGNKYYNANALAEDGVTYTGSWSNEDGSVNSAITLTPHSEYERYYYVDGTDTYYLYEVNKWYKDEALTDAAEGVTSIMANVKVGELDDPDFVDRLNAEVENHKLGEVIKIEAGDAVILQKLKNVKIKELSDTVENMYLGDLMDIHVHSGDDYKFEDPNGNEFWHDEALDSWRRVDSTALAPTIKEGTNGRYYYEDAGTIVELKPVFKSNDDITKMIAGYTIKEVSSSDFGTNLIADIKTEVKIGTFFTRNSCQIFELFTEEEFNVLTIGGMPDAIQDKLANATLGNAVTLGILDASTFAGDNGKKACNIYNLAYSTSITDWKNIPAKDFLTAVINSAFDAMP